MNLKFVFLLKLLNIYPPERLDEYLQSIRKVTSETLVISTPQRKTEEWVYDGGEHIYMNIMLKNF